MSTKKKVVQMRLDTVKSCYITPSAHKYMYIFYNYDTSPYIYLSRT